jgi:hypothetical protein
MVPLVAPLLEEELGRKDLCILAARVAMETAKYFGIEAQAVPVKVIAYNAAFAKRIEEGKAHEPYATWEDGSWSVGIGWGKGPEPKRWDGHLIVVAAEGDGEIFGDYSIQQAERPEHKILTGPGIVGPFEGGIWKVGDDESETVVEYCRIQDDCWKHAPDWKNEGRRRPLVGKLIRILREQLTT